MNEESQKIKISDEDIQKVKISVSDLSENRRDNTDVKQDANPSHGKPFSTSTRASEPNLDHVTYFKWVAIVLFIVIAGVGTWFFVQERSDPGSHQGSVTESVKAIERVMAEDRLTTEGVTSVGEVVRRMRAINTFGCPKEFRHAYSGHISAWEDMQKVEEEVQRVKDRYESVGAMIEAFVRGSVYDFGILGEAEAAYAKVREMNEEASRKIQSTFQQVEGIAIEYGASFIAKY